MGVARERLREILSERPDAGIRTSVDERGVGTELRPSHYGTARRRGRKQDSQANVPRHISTRPTPAVRFGK